MQIYVMLVIIAGIGAGLAAAGAATLIAGAVSRAAGSVSGKIKARRLRKEAAMSLMERIKNIKKSGSNEEIIKLLAVAGAGGIFAAFALPGLMAKLYGFVIGACLGAFIYTRYDSIKQGGENVRQLKEAVLLYDTVDVFTSRGYSVAQALEKSLGILKNLRPAVEKCLRKYPYGPAQSIASMTEEMSFEEAGTLVSVLMQLMAGGAGSEIAGTEAVRLEKIRRSLARTTVAMRPTYQQFRLYMPLMCGAALVLYCLLRHVQVQLGSLSGMSVIDQVVK